MAILKIDGLTFDVKIDVRRTARIESSEISGTLLDLSYFNDVKGTYYDYDITLKFPLRDKGKYDSLYEALTAPVDGHRFVFPYNHTAVEITARVESVPDQWVERDGRRAYWRALQFTALANHPTRALTLSEAITRGRAPLPEAADPSEGDTYIYSDGTWVEAPIYEDADDKSY